MRQRNSATIGTLAAEPTSRRRPPVAPAAGLPLCCRAWIGETAHTWHRQQGHEPPPSYRGEAPDRT